MKTSSLVVVLSLALFVGIVCAGCVQSSGSTSQSQSGGNAVSPAQTAAKSASPAASLPQTTPTLSSYYSVGMSVNHSTAATSGGLSKPATVLWYNGGSGAAHVQSIYVTINDNKVGQMGPYSSTPVPVGTSITLPITSQDNTNHVVAVAHYSDGKTQVVFDTTI